MAATLSHKRPNPPSSYQASDDESSRDFTDTASDSDFDFKPQMQNDSKRLKMSIERKPTRKPNPKVTNRNAMLARENRQKKKDLLDQLEIANNAMSSDIKKMRKEMKIKDATIQQLEQERNYLKSIIANKTEILSVFKAVQRAGIAPMTSSSLAYVKTTAINNNNINKPLGGFSGFSPCSGYESAPSVRSTNDDDDDEPLISGYDGLLNEPLEIPLLEDELSTLEHNYNKSSISKAKPSAGICVHICDSRISLELCSRCSYNADNAWMEEN